MRMAGNALSVLHATVSGFRHPDEVFGSWQRPRVRSTPLLCFRGSEYELQRQLRRARAADLIQRIEAAILAATSQRGSQHLSRLLVGGRNWDG